MTKELEEYYEIAKEDLNNFTNEELENIKQICNEIIKERKAKEIEKLIIDFKEITNKLLDYDTYIYYKNEFIDDVDYFEFNY